MRRRHKGCPVPHTLGKRRAQRPWRLSATIALWDSVCKARALGRNGNSPRICASPPFFARKTAHSRRNLNLLAPKTVQGNKCIYTLRESLESETTGVGAPSQQLGSYSGPQKLALGLRIFMAFTFTLAVFRSRTMGTSSSARLSSCFSRAAACLGGPERRQRATAPSKQSSRAEPTPKAPQCGTPR
eukprot:scaffold2850_cov235-Pinguiococcus_pyrenoidosus.AAC.14